MATAKKPDSETEPATKPASKGQRWTRQTARDAYEAGELRWNDYVAAIADLDPE